MNEIILHIGSNKGNREKHLETTRTLIENHLNPIQNKSIIFETEAWGVKAQADFLNQVLIVNSYLKPLQLLKRLQKIEAIIGKEKEFHWGPRNIDIDILFIGNMIINEKRLTIPHPLIEQRKFVLAPLAEIFPDKIHPISKKSVAQLLIECEDNLKVKQLSDIFE
jgi:2-amino-4-hydroxy-6-hydroxymethyldihydropteridine diphosphokinase